MKLGLGVLAATLAVGSTFASSSLEEHALAVFQREPAYISAKAAYESLHPGKEFNYLEESSACLQQSPQSEICDRIREIPAQATFRYEGMCALARTGGVGGTFLGLLLFVVAAHPAAYASRNDLPAESPADRGV